MTLAARYPLNFQVGARTLASVPRRLVRVPYALADVRGGQPPRLPALAPGAHGYVVTSMPADQLGALGDGGLIPFVRQRYTRYFVAMDGSHDVYLASLSGNARQGIRRKTKKLADLSGGAIDIRTYRTPDELAAFHALARRVAVMTYQERLLGSALPDTPDFVARMTADAAADRVRAWLLFLKGEPIAYLYCPAQGDTLIYEYVGHDPAHSALSPGAVLHMAALRTLFDEGCWRWFDFTEGEGQHKRQFATGGIDCVDVLLLRRTLANHAVVAASAAFDGAVSLAKRAVARAGGQRFARRLRRG